MVLVDTSVWAFHLREGDTRLKKLLMDGEVLSHPFIVGELACGNLKNRPEILFLLQSIPVATEAKHEEVLHLMESHRLMGKGLGYVDVHLIASATLSGVPVWTLDKRLAEVSAGLGMAM
jgi:predicted nucleic acid-binding protein